MSVFDEGGATVQLLSLWQSRKAIVAFTRHMGCRFCKEQVLLLEMCRDKYLHSSDVVTIIVTIGRYQDIPVFRAETGFTGEIYVDTDLNSPKCYQLMRFHSGAKVLFQDAAMKELRADTSEAAKRSTVTLPDGGYGDGEVPFTGDVLQVDGQT